MSYKYFFKSTAAIAFGILISSSEALAFTCPDSNNPEVVSSDCTQMVVQENKSSVTINSGVTVSDGGTGSAYGPVRIAGSAIVGVFTNNGNIENTNTGNLTAIEIANGSGVTNFVNTGNISTMASSTFAGLKIYGSINTLTNSGTIAGSTGAGGIYVSEGGNIGTLVNSANGHINGTAGSAAIMISGGIFSTATSVGSITNLGVIQGIHAESGGVLGTLNNLQSGLSYSGNLPSNYNVIISGAGTYGKTTFSSVSGGPTTFGISPLSTLPSGANRFANVLSGLTSSNLTATTGIYGGGIVSTPWTLSNGGAGTNWSLTTTVGAAVKPIISGSSPATNLAGSMTSAYLNALSGGANPILANGTTLASAVQGLTTSQVNQLINVHAEGYSSNMTIGLEQMAHITNTVMDRIHAPISSSPTTKVYQDDEGRYVWADAAAVRGTVNNYNNLAGFGYNLYDLIIGGDIKRTKDGGYGVFAGTGTTSMTESQQVTQNFNTTNFYAGLYGAHNFTEQVKLSGALGYMYGNTNANRNTPSVGQFTGGNATSSYKTNGVYGAAKLAKAYQFSDVTVSPFVGASYSQLWMGGASEQGGNDFNFGINSATAYTAVTFAGADFVFPLLKGVNNPLSLIGFYKFGYDWYANSNSAHSITATSPTYGSFTQVGGNMGPVSNMFGLGIQGGISKDVSARIGVVASTNSYGQEYGGGAELRVKF
ncbi:MAG: autotransporter outer membrane beta-barrel domain-containing protein [Polynucleobacter sp.]